MRVRSLLPLLDLISAINGHAWSSSGMVHYSPLKICGWVGKEREVWGKYVICLKYLEQEAMVLDLGEDKG